MAEGNALKTYQVIFFFFFLVLSMLPATVEAQGGGDQLIVHIRSAAATLNHAALKHEELAQEIAGSLANVEGVTGTRVQPVSGMVEVRFDASKTTGEQVANAARKIMEGKLAGKPVEARNLPSGQASSRVLVKALGRDKVQLTSERFY